jgi:5-(aminomethyl)-3-furanmethanol phosphate kinase
VSDGTPIVVKIGGGLLRAEGLEGLRRACADATEIARVRPVLVVPGGGPFADAVRAIDAQLGLGDAVAHRLALHAMDQMGVLLASLLPNPEVSLLRVVQAFAGYPEIPESWMVTSDSLAVLTAGAIGAEEAILLKPAAGLLTPLAQLTADELETLQKAGGAGAVDAYLPEAIRRTGVTVVVRSPGSGSASGTRIAKGFQTPGV